MSKLQKIQVSGFKRNLGYAQYAQSWVFLKKIQKLTLLLLYYSACKKTAGMVFNEVIGYPTARFEYKAVSKRYFAEI